MPQTLDEELLRLGAVPAEDDDEERQLKLLGGKLAVGEPTPSQQQPAPRLQPLYTADQVPGAGLTGLPGVQKVPAPWDLGGPGRGPGAVPAPPVVDRSGVQQLNRITPKPSQAYDRVYGGDRWGPAPVLPDTRIPSYEDTDISKWKLSPRTTPEVQDYLSTDGAQGLNPSTPDAADEPAPERDAPAVDRLWKSLKQGTATAIAGRGQGLQALARPLDAKGMPGADLAAQAGEYIESKAMRGVNLMDRQSATELWNDPNKTVGSVLQWGAETALENAPQMAMTIAAGTIGTPIAGVIDAFLANAGEQFDDLTKKGMHPAEAGQTAVAGAILATPMDYIVPGKVIAALRNSPLPEELKRSIKRRVFEGAKDIGWEGITESGQKAAAIFTEGMKTGKWPTWPEFRDAMINEGIPGMIGGAGPGIVTQVAEHRDEINVGKKLQEVRDHFDALTNYHKKRMAAGGEALGDQAPGAQPGVQEEEVGVPPPVQQAPPGAPPEQQQPGMEPGGGPAEAPIVPPVTPPPVQQPPPPGEAPGEVPPVGDEVPAETLPGSDEKVPPPGPPPLEGEALYGAIFDMAAQRTQVDLRQIQQELGVSPEAAQEVLDSMVPAGVLGAKPLKDGTVSYVNLTLKRERGGKSPITKAAKEEDIVEEGIGPPPGEAAPPEGAPPPVVAPPPPSQEGEDRVGEPPPLPDQGKEDVQGQEPPPALGQQGPPAAPAAPQPSTPVVEPSTPVVEEKQELPERPPEPRLAEDVFEMDPRQIETDPVRFQFKRDTGGKAGVGDEMKDPDVPWNRRMAGTITVWKDPADGKTYVVNGHHRLEKAQRMGVPSIKVQYSTAATAMEARAEGALDNIAEGRGTSIDAAKFLRDSGLSPEQVKAQGVHLKGEKARQGTALARLPDSLFEDLLTGDMRVERGVVIGEGLENHADMLAIAKAGKDMTDGALAELIRRTKAKAAEMKLTDEERERIRIAKEQGEQPSLFGDMFGGDQAGQSLEVQEAILSDAIKKRLGQEKRLFGAVGKKGVGQTLARGGNVIEEGQNRAIAADAAQALEVYNALSLKAGDISKALTAGAARIQAGEKLSAVIEDTYAAVKAAVIRETNRGAKPEGSGVLAPQNRTGDVADTGRRSGDQPSEELRGAARTAPARVGEKPGPVPSPEGKRKGDALFSKTKEEQPGRVPSPEPLSDLDLDAADQQFQRATFRFPKTAAQSPTVYANQGGMYIIELLHGGDRLQGSSINDVDVATLMGALEDNMNVDGLSKASRDNLKHLHDQVSKWRETAPPGAGLNFVRAHKYFSDDIKMTAREELLHAAQRVAALKDQVMEDLMKTPVFAKAAQAVREMGYDVDPIQDFKEVTAKVLSGDALGLTMDERVEVAQAYRKALLDAHGEDAIVLFRYAKPGEVKEAFRGRETGKEGTGRAERVQPEGGVELQRSAARSGEGEGEGGGRGQGVRGVPEGAVEPRRGEQTTIDLEEQPDDAAKLLGERLTAGFAGELSPEEKRRKLKPAKVEQQGLFGPTSEPSRQGTLFSRGSNKITDPKFVEEKSRALLGEVVRGNIKIADIEAGLVGQYGEEHRAIAKRVADQVQDWQDNPVRHHDAEGSTRIPKSVKSKENPVTGMLITGLKSFLESPEQVRKSAAAIRKYTTVPRVRGETSQQTIERFIEQTKDNLIWLYNKTKEEVRERSKLWYDGGRKIAADTAEKYGVAHEQAAAVLAVFSPQKDWFQNVDMARRFQEFIKQKDSLGWTGEMEDAFRKVRRAKRDNDARKLRKQAQKIADGEEVTKKFVPSKTLQRNYNAIKNKTYSELTNDSQKALWFRLWDEGHNPREFHVITPEGNRGEVVVLQKGKRAGEPAKMAWSSYVPIKKAISIMEDGSLENISKQLGKEHKVRNFYNNILDPDNPNGHVTIDTHAVAAGHLRPFGGSALEVKHNLGAGPSSAMTGESGLYALYDEAYRRAGMEAHLLPREIQSITWEAVRGLFPAEWKTRKNNKAVEAIWRQVKRGSLTVGEAREQIYKLADGIRDPAWFKAKAGSDGRGLSDTQGDAGRGTAARPGDIPGPGVSGSGTGPGGLHGTGTGSGTTATLSASSNEVRAGGRRVEPKWNESAAGGQTAGSYLTNPPKTAKRAAFERMVFRFEKKTPAKGTLKSWDVGSGTIYLNREALDAISHIARLQSINGVSGNWPALHSITEKILNDYLRDPVQMRVLGPRAEANLRELRNNLVTWVNQVPVADHGTASLQFTFAEKGPNIPGLRFPVRRSTAREELLHAAQRLARIKDVDRDRILLMPTFVKAEAWLRQFGGYRNVDKQTMFDEITAKVLAGDKIPVLSQAERIEVAKTFREALIKEHGEAKLLLFKYVQPGDMKDTFRGKPTTTTSPPATAPSPPAVKPTPPTPTPAPVLTAPPRQMGLFDQPSKPSTTSPTTTTTAPKPLSRPVQMTLFNVLQAAAEKADARLRRLGVEPGVSARVFGDPKVSRDMAIAIAIDVARGDIDAKNFTSEIVDRFGSGARSVARQVYRRAQATHRHAASAGTVNFRTSAAPQGLTTPPTAVVPSNITPSQATANPAGPPSRRFLEIRDKQKERRTEGERSLYDKFKAGMQKAGAMFNRQFAHLVSGARFAELRQRLNFVSKAQGTSIHKAAQAIIDQLEKLSKDEYTQFIEVVTYNDMWARVEQQMREGKPVLDKDLWWGIKDTHELAALRGEARARARANPKVTAALNMRQQMWPQIRKDYVNAMKKAGVDVSKAMARKDYFRHRVWKHLELKEAANQTVAQGGGSRFKLPTARSWLKKAEVNSHDYSLDYVRAEFEVLSQMMYDTARANFVGWLKDESGHNIAKDLMKQAAIHNKATIMPTFARMAKHYNRVNRGRGVSMMTAEAMYQKVMRMRPKDPSWRRRVTMRLAGAEYVGSLEKALNTFKKDTHDIYSADERSHFYMAPTIPDTLAKAIQAAGAGTVLDKQIRRVLAKGGKHGQMVLPKEVVETLKEFMQGPQGTAAEWASKIGRKPLELWKMSKLIHPGSVIKYNLRNLSGDLERVLAVNPHAVVHAGTALKEIIEFKRTGKMPSQEFKEWWERGGMDSNLQVAEIGEINKLRKLEHLLLDPDTSLAGKGVNGAINLWRATWNATRTATDIREGILRYATFIEYRNQITANGGRPKNFGASRREEVMALRNRNDRAYKLSNDLMLAYDEVSAGGQFMRRYLIPFWSFQEQNARAYKRIVVNAWKDGRQSAALGYAMAGTVGAAARIGAWTMTKLASQSMRLLALKTLTELWNNYVMDDEEDDLPESVRKGTHIILGRDSNGKVRVFSRLGTMDDLLEWGGIDAAPFYVREWMNGRMDFNDLVEQTTFRWFGMQVPFKSAVNKVAQSATPYVKTTGEYVFGRTAFPDVFKQREIRDRGEYLARELGVVGLYKKAIAKPQEKFLSLDKLMDFVIYRYDPGEVHYNSFRYDKVAKWGAENGKDIGGGGYSVKKAAEALYDFRMAIRYDDKGALAKALADYKDAGGTKQNLKKSIERLHPLGALTNEKLKREFRNSLTAHEKEQLEKAESYWREHFKSKEAEIMTAATEAKLPFKKVRPKK